MSPLPPDAILQAIASPRWSGLLRLDLDTAQLERWDPSLIRQPRVLVPIDVQTLYVEEGSTDTFVRLPFALTARDGEDPEPMPKPFDPGVKRAPGVHLHWAPPDALLRGDLDAVESGSSNRLKLGVLPDRWVVLRIVAPNGAISPHVRGWVLEADRARAVPLEAWPAGADGVEPQGRTLQPEELTGTAGGTLNWAGVYDAVRNRLAFHDPLDDIPKNLPNGAFASIATYVVAGWWSKPELDPLDGAQTTASLHARLEELGWHLTGDAEGGHALSRHAELKAAYRDTLGVKTAQRYLSASEAQFQSNAPRALSPEARITQLAETTMPFEVGRSVLVDQVSSAVATEPKWPRMTLLHGTVHGVPVAGKVVVDQRPTAKGVGVAFGWHMDDLIATLAAAELGATDAESRRSLERTLAAFTGQLLPRLGTDDGVVDVDEHEHAAAFESLPGGDGGEDRLRPAGESGPLAAGSAGRSASVMKNAAFKSKGVGDVSLVFSEQRVTKTSSGGVSAMRKQLDQRRSTGTAQPPDARVTRRPAPRYHRPIEPVVAVRGAKRSLRHGKDGRFSADGLLHCRWPSQLATAVEGVIDGATLIPSLGSGAIPDEVLDLARNALVTDPYLSQWLANAAARRRNLPVDATLSRFAAEAVLRFGLDGTYDGGGGGMVKDPGARSLAGARIADQLRRFSLVRGVDADPVGVTAWSQPWVPLWLEWEATLRGTNRLDGWRLDAVDLDRDDDPSATSPAVTFTGRSALNTGTAVALAAAIAEWRDAEEARDQDNQGEAEEETEEALSRIANAIEHLDLLSASLEGLHARLLGLPVGPFGVVHARNGGTIERPVPVDLPRLLAEGRLTLGRMRIVDAFGRTLDLPTSAIRTPARDEIEAAPATLRFRPRLLRPARWLFRFVDPADLTITSPEANVDQVVPANMKNPVAGFLLPDHIDEALEFFDTAGTPLGQLMHEPFGGGVVWEIAPGRSGPHDAGPLYDLAPAQQILGLTAAGLVSVDAATRGGRPIEAGRESALTAMLRAIDTTLWTVDTFSGFGTEHIAGLVGRPIAGVRALLRLDIDDDLDELDLSDAAIRAAREAAYAELADRAFPVRLGELTRSDDGLLAFFVDDDYTRLHVVDRAVRDGALDRSQLGRIGTTPQVPGTRPIDHPYIVAEDELRVRPGQVVRLTLLMHPAGRVHLTSGILPRKALALAHDWVQPGLSVMAPSVRVGPVLIDPGEVRLPKVSVFPKDQLWTRRTSPDTWRDDPILAATQTALLPELPHEVQEGYIRVAPVVKEGLEES